MKLRDMILSLILLTSGVISFICIILFLLATFIAIANVANAQEHSHPPEDIPPHEQLYAKWIRPDKPHLGSCCNNHDCYPTEFKRINGIWYALQRETQQWVEVPP